MTGPDPALDAAAGAVYDVLRTRALRDAGSALLGERLRHLMPAEFTDLHPDRAEHYRSVASAALQAHQLHAALHAAVEEQGSD